MGGVGVHLVGADRAAAVRRLDRRIDLEDVVDPRRARPPPRLRRAPADRPPPCGSPRASPRGRRSSGKRLPIRPGSRVRPGEHPVGRQTLTLRRSARLRSSRDDRAAAAARRDPVVRGRARRGGRRRRTGDAGPLVVDRLPVDRRVSIPPSTIAPATRIAAEATGRRAAASPSGNACTRVPLGRRTRARPSRVHRPPHGVRDRSRVESPGVDLDVVFLGTSGSMPTAQRAPAAALVRRGGERLLFDCAEGTQRQLLRSDVGLAELREVFLTHYHADHYLGLPGMLKTFALRGRELPLTVYGPRGPRDLLRARCGGSSAGSPIRSTSSSSAPATARARRLRGSRPSRSTTAAARRLRAPRGRAARAASTSRRPTRSGSPTGPAGRAAAGEPVTLADGRVVTPERGARRRRGRAGRS